MNSSWIEDIKYRSGRIPVPTGPDSITIGYNALAIWTDRGEVLLYVGKTEEALPSWLSGLLQMWHSEGKQSIGRAYNKLVKVKGQDDVWYQRVTDRDKVYELRKMFRV